MLPTEDSVCDPSTPCLLDIAVIAVESGDFQTPKRQARPKIWFLFSILFPAAYLVHFVVLII